MANNSARIIYSGRADATPQAELDALVSVYRFILDCHAKKKADKPAPEPVGRDGTKVKEDSANENYTR